MLDAHRNHSESLLYMNADRVLYVGQLGNPTERVLGSYTIYASCYGALDLSAETPARIHDEIAIIPPYLPHKVSIQEKNILCLMIEPEFLNADSIFSFGQDDQSAHADLLSRMRKAHLTLSRTQPAAHKSIKDLDTLIFGHGLPTKPIDKRIEQIIRLMRNDPTNITAPVGAACCKLSTSRFMHLFKHETGTCFRDFRRWKRARNLLSFITSNKDLTAIALELGYSDSSHFSNSIRYFSGLRPKDIIYGSRKAHLIPFDF